MKAFKIKINNRFFDYRIGEKLNLREVKTFFENKNYKITKFINSLRHIGAVLGGDLFLKLSTSKGVSIVTENEASWNDTVFNKLPVPKIHDRGYFKNDYFYMITDYVNGQISTPEIIKDKLDEIVNLSEKIMSLKIPLLPADDYNPGYDHREKFINKVQSHLESIPKQIRQKYHLEELFQLIKTGALIIKCRPRHGDFAPWHLIINTQSPATDFYLIDGEHAMSQSVEYYDIGYFIQRVFSVWKKKEIAKKVYQKLIKRNYDKNKLKTILLARAIGGFLDEFLTGKPAYKIHEDFKNWSLSI